MEMVQFTEGDENISPILGPEYGASTRFAEAMLEKFEAEHLRPLVEKVSEEFRDRLWSDVNDYLLSDAEINAAGAIRYMVEQTVVALLTGKEWAMERYPYADYSKGEGIRKAVAKHGGEKLLMKRISELEAEIQKKEETIQWMRR